MSVQWRDGKLEQITEATTRGVGLQLYVDGRYASVTHERPAARGARHLHRRRGGDDPHAVRRTRSARCPIPRSTRARPTLDLELEDPAYPTVTPEQRRRARAGASRTRRARCKGAEAILSVTTGFSDTRSEIVARALQRLRGRAASTRRSGSRRRSASRTTTDAGPRTGRRRGVRFVGELPRRGRGRPRGRRSARSRASASKKAESAVLPMVLDNRAAGASWAPCSARCPAQSLQQKRSFLEGKLGQAIGSDSSTSPTTRSCQGLRLAPVRRRGHRRAEAARLRGRRACATTTSTPTTARSSKMRAHHRQHSNLDLEPRATKSQAELAGRHEGRHPRHRLPRRQLERHHRRLLARRAGLPDPRRRRSPSRWRR